MQGYLRLASCSAFALAALRCCPAIAQEVPQEPAARDATTSDIIVTARKRAESLQNVPISVTAVNAATIERDHIVRIDQLGQITPNVVMQFVSIYPTDLTAFIRGIGTSVPEPTQDMPIAVSIDGVYLANTGGSLVDVFDAQQIEVLRGPQGTLQGRSAPGGAINITTKRPTGSYAANFEASYASFNEANLKAAVEAPIATDVLAVRLSGFSNSGGNFMHNINLGGMRNGGLQNWGARIGLLFTPSHNFKAYLTADYMHDTSPQPALRPVPHVGSAGPFEPAPKVCTVYGYCTPFPKYENASGFDQPDDTRSGGVGLVADWDLGPVTLTSVTGYRKVDQDIVIDDDALPPVIFHSTGSIIYVRSTSQELRISSNGDHRLSYVAGVYGLHSHAGYQEQTVVLGGALQNRTTDSVTVSSRGMLLNSYAFFAQASYKITDRWSISAGGRQTYDDKHVVTQPNLASAVGTFDVSFKNLSLEAGTEYRISHDKLAYFRFSQGYRPGGINGDASNLAAVNDYRSETVNSYEIGLKSSWLDRAVTANLSAFYYDYKDLQVSAMEAYPGGFATRLVNAPGVDIKGIEAEITLRPTSRFDMTASVGYLDAKYRSALINLGLGLVDLATIPKQFAPKMTIYVGVNYDLPLPGGKGDIIFNGDLNYKSRELTLALPSPEAFQSPYALANAGLTYRTEDKRYSIGLFVRNLTNTYYKLVGATGGGGAYYIWDLVGRPRSYGVRLTGKF